MRITVLTQPTVEPITLAEARDHLRLDATGSPATHEDDGYVELLIQAAREYVENITNRPMVQRQYKLTIPYWCNVMELPYSTPLVSVDSVKYLDINGTQQTLASSIYDVVSDMQPSRIVRAYGQVWPSIRNVHNAIEITYTTGYAVGSPADYRENIPQALKGAVKMVVADLYENREQQQNVQLYKNRAVEALLSGYRVEMV
jgi:uncharacterized phiE125 gp8 family phage protein